MDGMMDESAHIQRQRQSFIELCSEMLQHVLNTGNVMKMEKRGSK